MSIFFLLFVFFIPIDILSMSVAPEKAPPPTISRSTKILVSTFNDRKTKSVYYETLPIITETPELGLISFLPLIIQNNVTGELKLQINFSFFPSTNTNSTIQSFKPLSIKIASNKKELIFPLINKPRNSPQTISIQEGTLFIFPKDISNLVSLISDAQTVPYNHLSIPISQLQEQQNFTHTAYSLQELQQNYINFADQKPLTMINKGRELGTSHSPRAQQGLVIILNNDENKESIIMGLSPYYTSILAHILNFYTQL